MNNEKLLANIQYDFAFIESIRKEGESGADKKADSYMLSFVNGLPYNYYLIFKTCLLMFSDKCQVICMRDVQKTFTDIYGVTPSQPTYSRAKDAMIKVGLLAEVNNIKNDQKFSFVKLTAKGLRLKRMLLGQTTEWKNRLRIFSVAELNDNICLEESSKANVA